MTPATVFTHVYNEELLLPYWLRHHREIFDHGVIIDRGSTDGTRAIIRELAPDWDVVESRNPLFDARDTDMEVMALERGFEGWKVALNATELLVGENVRASLAAVERDRPEVRTLGVPMIVMVDTDPPPAPLDDRPLPLQRPHGSRTLQAGMRFVHREAHGAYTTGRHMVTRPYAVDDELAVLRYTWSPWPDVRRRRLQIADAIPAADVEQGLSWAHLFTPEELDEQFASLTRVTRDVREDERLATAIAALDRPWRPRPAAAPRIPLDDRRRVVVLFEDADGSRAAAVGDPLGEVHEVLDAREAAPERLDELLLSADVVIADNRACLAHRLIQRVLAPMIVDLTAVGPAEADPLVLRRADHVLWRAEDFEQWRARFTELGRLTDGANGPDHALLGTPVPPGATAADMAGALQAFVISPRRVTAAVVQDGVLPVSRLAYYRRMEAMIAVIMTNHVTAALANANAQLRAEVAGLREELARLRGS